MNLVMTSNKTAKYYPSKNKEYKLEYFNVSYVKTSSIKSFEDLERNKFINTLRQLPGYNENTEFSKNVKSTLNNYDHKENIGVFVSFVYDGKLYAGFSKKHYLDKFDKNKGVCVAVANAFRFDNAVNIGYRKYIMSLIEKSNAFTIHFEKFVNRMLRYYYKDCILNNVVDNLHMFDDIDNEDEYCSRIFDVIEEEGGLVDQINMPLWMTLRPVVTNELFEIIYNTLKRQIK